MWKRGVEEGTVECMEDSRGKEEKIKCLQERRVERKKGKR
jgi:hypothetical protein